jgi:hypothetical protein
MTGMPAIELQENIVRQAAEELGPDSGPAKALANLDRRRAKGENVILVSAMEQLFVAPRDAFDGKTLHLQGEDNT